MATSTGRGDWPFLSTWLGDAKPWNLQTAAADGPDQTIWSDWFLDAAAGGGTEALSGIATLTLTASGNLTSVTSLSGTATLALTASGALLSTTALSGTATLAITASGELVSTTALSGAATLALDASGELNSTTALSGTASLILTATGALVSTTSLGGSATLALTATGDLTLDGAATVTVEEPTHRSGGAGHRVRLARYWKGKYAGYYNDIEWTEWLLAVLSAEVSETPKPKAPKKLSRKIRRIVVEPEAYIEKAYPESVGALLELKLETVLALAEQHHSEQVAKIAKAALYKKRRREEEDDIAFLLLAA